MSFQKIAIIGAGQIGTSLALEIASKRKDAEVVVLDVNPELREDFYKKFDELGVACDRIKFTTQAKDVAGSDLVVLATPISQFDPAIRSITSYLSTATVVTDVGSAKERSIETIQNALPEGIAYVGGHILNGNKESGPNSASAGLFENKPFIVVPTGASEAIQTAVENFWKSLGANVTVMDAAKHDTIVGTLSHLEHVLMFSLMKTSFMQDALTERGLSDPGNWVQAMTRIAEAGPEMWTPIFIDNREKILETAKHLRRDLAELSKAVQRGVPLDDTIAEAHAYAARMPSPNTKPDDLTKHEREDMKRSTFAALLSLAITRNVQRIEKETGQSIELIANPSIKDGMSLIANSPESAATLFKAHAKEMRAMTVDYLAQLDTLIFDIENRDRRNIRETVKQVSKDRKDLKEVFGKAPTLQAAATQLHPA